MHTRAKKKQKLEVTMQEAIKELFTYVKVGDIESLISVYKALGLDIDAIKDEFGNSLLHQAVIYQQKEVVQLLLAWGIRVNQTNHHGVIPIQFAVRRNLVELTDLLVKEGADLKVMSFEGNSLLHEAVQHGYHQIIKILLDAGMEVDQVNKQQRTPMHIALLHNDTIAMGHLSAAGSKIDATQYELSTSLKIIFNLFSLQSLLKYTDIQNGGSVGLGLHLMLRMLKLYMEDKKGEICYFDGIYKALSTLDQLDSEEEIDLPLDNQISYFQNENHVAYYYAVNRHQYIEVTLAERGQLGLWANEDNEKMYPFLVLNIPKQHYVDEMVALESVFNEGDNQRFISYVADLKKRLESYQEKYRLIPEIKNGYLNKTQKAFKAMCFFENLKSLVYVLLMKSTDDKTAQFMYKDFCFYMHKQSLTAFSEQSTEPSKDAVLQSCDDHLSCVANKLSMFYREIKVPSEETPRTESAKTKISFKA